MRVLIACEFSGIVRGAFRRAGHEAWSCDLLASEIPGDHIEGDVTQFLTAGWDMMIAFPPCTYLANSGARWLYQNGRGTVKNPARWDAMSSAADFFIALLKAPIPRIAIENPPMHKAARALVPPYNEIINPWQFGHGETKRTAIWRKNLPALVSTQIVAGRIPRVHFAQPGPGRWKERSRTLPGIAEAMATQWGAT